MLLKLKLSLIAYFLVPRPPRSAVAGDYWIRVRPSVCLSVCPSTFFYSATELQNYWAESNETFYNERIYIKVVHLGIGFVMRPKLGSIDIVKNEESQHNLEFTIPRPNSTSTRQNRMQLSAMKEYILKFCTWVLVSSCDQNWGRTTWSKMRNFNTIWSLLFRNRTPQLRGTIE